MNDQNKTTDRVKGHKNMRTFMFPRASSRTMAPIIQIAGRMGSNSKASVFHHCLTGDAEILSYGIGCGAFREALSDFPAHIDIELRPAYTLALGPRPGHARLGALGNLLRFDLGER